MASHDGWPERMFIEKYGGAGDPGGILLDSLDVFPAWIPPVAGSRSSRNASANLEGSRSEKDTSGSGCNAIEENDESVAPWYDPSCSFATTTDTGYHHQVVQLVVIIMNDVPSSRTCLWNMPHGIPNVLCNISLSMIPSALACSLKGTTR